MIFNHLGSTGLQVSYVHRCFTPWTASTWADDCPTSLSQRTLVRRLADYRRDCQGRPRQGVDEDRFRSVTPSPRTPHPSCDGRRLTPSRPLSLPTIQTTVATRLTLPKFTLMGSPRSRVSPTASALGCVAVTATNRYPPLAVGRVIKELGWKRCVHQRYTCSPFALILLEITGRRS